MEVTVKQVAWHRNGIGGEGFHAVLFEYDDGDQSDNGGLMLGIVFDGPGQCAVVSVPRLSDPKMGVAFGRGNSWRGDHFEEYLRDAIAKTQSAGSVRMGPFGLPTDLVIPAELAERLGGKRKE